MTPEPCQPDACKSQFGTIQQMLQDGEERMDAMEKHQDEMRGDVRTVRESIIKIESAIAGDPEFGNDGLVKKNKANRELIENHEERLGKIEEDRRTVKTFASGVSYVAVALWTVISAILSSGITIAIFERIMKGPK